MNAADVGGLKRAVKSHLTAVDDLDLAGRLSRPRANDLHALDGSHAFNDLPKHNVFAVEPRARHCAQEELRPVGVGAGVGHREDPRAVV